MVMEVGTDTEVEIEKILVESFEILENDNEIGFSFDLEDGDVTSADFIYDGGNCAILIRNDAKAYLFINIVKELREKIINSERIIIIEEKDDEILNSYVVGINKVEKIPFEDTLTGDLLELLEELKEMYGEDGVRRIAEEVWNLE